MTAIRLPSTSTMNGPSREMSRARSGCESATAPNTWDVALIAWRSKSSRAGKASTGSRRRTATESASCKIRPPLWPTMWPPPSASSPSSRVPSFSWGIRTEDPPLSAPCQSAGGGLFALPAPIGVLLQLRTTVPIRHLSLQAANRILPRVENGGVRLDSAIPCSSIITRGPRLSAQQLHRSVHPLDTAARVATSLRAPL